MATDIEEIIWRLAHGGRIAIIACLKRRAPPMSEPEIIEPKWEDAPVNVADLDCFIGELPDGSWLISRNRSPWFCFGGEIRDQVFAKAERAISFWRDSEQPPQEAER